MLMATMAVLSYLTSSPVQARDVSCLGRIEPENGVYALAGPAASAVVDELRVAVGDRVAADDVLATLDNHALARAELQRAQAELDFAHSSLKRERGLKGASSKARLEEAERNVRVGEAVLAAAQARLERAQVRAPVAGEILAIHAREGERIGADGLLELGMTERMYVVAEVYETDIGLVSLGQEATITSPALQGRVSGRVAEVGRLVARVDALALDPVARTDARVIEVRILLDDPARVAGLTNLQVDVEISQ
jgi:HlyD family secretion protein